jgi:hypothetical protein
MIDIGSLQQHKIRFSDGVLDKLMQHTCFDLTCSHSHFPSNSTLFPTDPPFFNTQSHQVRRLSISTSYLDLPSQNPTLTLPSHLPRSSSLSLLSVSRAPLLWTQTRVYISHTLRLSFSPPSFHTLTFPTRSCLDLFSLNSNPQKPTPSSNKMPPKKKTGTATDGAGDGAEGGVSFSVSFFFPSLRIAEQF